MTNSFQRFAVGSYAPDRVSSNTTASQPTQLVRLHKLMELTGGRAEVIVALIDGPVDATHPDLCVQRIQTMRHRLPLGCAASTSFECIHGTGVAGILHAERGCGAVAICPDCTLLVRPIFDGTAIQAQLPTATPHDLAEAIVDVVDQGACVVNISAGFYRPASHEERGIRNALDYAAKHSVIVAAAAGNQGTLGSSALTRHDWVIPVVAVGMDGNPTAQSNLGLSIGRRGLSAPGERIRTLAPAGQNQLFSGTIAATPFVTGTVALLRSLFPSATPADLRMAVVQSDSFWQRTVVPPRLNAWAAYETLKRRYREN